MLYKSSQTYCYKESIFFFEKNLRNVIRNCIIQFLIVCLQLCINLVRIAETFAHQTMIIAVAFNPNNELILWHGDILIFHHVPLGIHSINAKDNSGIVEQIGVDLGHNKKRKKENDGRKTRKIPFSSFLFVWGACGTRAPGSSSNLLFDTLTVNNAEHLVDERLNHVGFHDMNLAILGVIKCPNVCAGFDVTGGAEGHRHGKNP